MCVGDERAPSECPQKILFVVPVPQCEPSLFESSLSIRAVQKIPLQCVIGRREIFKGRKKKRPKRSRGKESGAGKVKGKMGLKKKKAKGKIGAPWHSWRNTLSIIFGAGLKKGVGRTGWLWTPG